jgi:hypothetical protein
MTHLSSLGKLPAQNKRKSMGTEHLMDAEISAMITRAEQRIDNHLGDIQENPEDKAFQASAKVLLAQMLSGLRRLETYRDTFR